MDVTAGNPEVVESVSYVLQQCEAQLPLWPLALIVKALLKVRPGRPPRQYSGV